MNSNSGFLRKIVICDFDFDFFFFFRINVIL